jgi:hypothetical protein
MVQTIHKVKNGNLTKEKIDYLEKKIIGIDPGKSGGIAWIENDLEINAKNCPDGADKMAELIKEIVGNDESICYMELVHAFPTDGRSSAFKFGVNFGIWKGILGTLNIKVELVSPRKWQNKLGELPKIKKDRKNMLKQMASDMSGLKATLKTSDAILIALYGYNELHG